MKQNQEDTTATAAPDETKMVSPLEQMRAIADLAASGLIAVTAKVMDKDGKSLQFVPITARVASIVRHSPDLFANIGTALTAILDRHPDIEALPEVEELRRILSQILDGEGGELANLMIALATAGDRKSGE
jgi:hypothetical protein